MFSGACGGWCNSIRLQSKGRGIYIYIHAPISTWERKDSFAITGRAPISVKRIEVNKGDDGAPDYCIEADWSHGKSKGRASWIAVGSCYT